MNKNLNKKIYIAGHTGMVGSSIVRNLLNYGYKNLILKTHAELDLLDQQSVNKFLMYEKPDEIYIAAGKVGGINANISYPAQFIYENLLIQINLIHNAFLCGTKKLLLLGSSCIYPKISPDSIKEESLLSGFIEETNEPYAIAKISGIKMCESYNRQYGKSHCLDYRCATPTNLYGPGDNYDVLNSHVIPALINKIHTAKVLNSPKVTLWGSGKPKREFLFIDDVATALILIMELDKKVYESQTDVRQNNINIGYGTDISISDLANTIAKIIGYSGLIVFDSSMSDGIQKKLLDSSKIKALGWTPKFTLDEGLKITYKCFKNNLVNK